MDFIYEVALPFVIEVALPIAGALLAIWIGYSLFVWFFTAELPRLMGVLLDNILKATGGT